MKILYVTGNDYSASNVKEKMGIEKAVKFAKDNGGSITVNNDELEIYDTDMTIFEFGEVDPRFVDFVLNELMDYDDSKHTNFYVIED